ncbi:MAG: hypothetical protein KR126chlam1_00565 [Chlamydiae bacterium]|nr:hypothetical protein [Chlamydiota bacterium]
MTTATTPLTPATNQVAFDHTRFIKDSLTNLAGNYMGWVFAKYLIPYVATAMDIPSDWHIQKVDLLFSSFEKCQTPLLCGGVLVSAFALLSCFGTFQYDSEVTKKDLATSKSPLEERVKIWMGGVVNGSFAKLLGCVVAPLEPMNFSFLKVTVSQSTFMAGLALVGGILGAHRAFLNRDVRQQHAS